MADLTPIPWHSVCNNPTDFFTLEPFSDDEVSESETIKIHYVDVNKIECFNREILQNYFKSLPKFETVEDGDEPKLIDGPTVEYVPRTTIRNVDDSGHGMVPLEHSAHYYRNPGQYGGYFTEVLVSKIMTNRAGEVIKVEKYPNLIRLGNIGGIFGISMLHGQAPGETIYKSVDEIFSRNIVHRWNWNVEIDRNCEKDFHCEDDNPSCVNVYIGDSYYIDTTNANIEHFNSKLTNGETNQTEIQKIQKDIKYYEEIKKNLTEQVISVDGQFFGKQPEIGRISDLNTQRPIFPLKVKDTCIFIDGITRMVLTHTSHRDISLVPIHISTTDPTIITRVWMFTSFRPVGQYKKDEYLFNHTIKQIYNLLLNIYSIFSDNSVVFTRINSVLHETMDDIWKFIAPNDIPIYEHGTNDYYYISTLIVVIRTFWKLFKKDGLIDLEDIKYSLDEFITIILTKTRREYSIKRVRKAFEENHPTGYCDNKVDIHGKDIKDMNYENFLLLETPEGKYYCYDIHELVKYLLEKQENINPYDEHDAIWSDGVLDFITDDDRVDKKDTKKLEDIFASEDVENTEELITSIRQSAEMLDIFIFIGCLGYYIVNSGEMAILTRIFEIIKEKIAGHEDIFNNLKASNGVSLKDLIDSGNDIYPEKALLEIFLYNLFKMHKLEDTYVPFIWDILWAEKWLALSPVRNDLNEINIDAYIFDHYDNSMIYMDVGKYTTPDNFVMNNSFLADDGEIRRVIMKDVNFYINQILDWLKLFSFKMGFPQLFGDLDFIRIKPNIVVDVQHHSKIPQTENIKVKLMDGYYTKNVNVDKLSVDKQYLLDFFNGKNELDRYRLSVGAYCALRLIKIIPETEVELTKMIGYGDYDGLYPTTLNVYPILKFSDFKPRNDEVKKYYNDIVDTISSIKQFYVTIESDEDDMDTPVTRYIRAGRHYHREDIIDTIDMIMFMIVGNDAIVRDIKLAMVIAIINTINRHESRPEQNDMIYNEFSAYFDIPRETLESFHLKFRYSYAYQYDDLSYIKDIMNKLPTDANGNTPLHQASVAGAKEIVRHMINTDFTSIKKTNNAGKTALDMVNEILSQPPDTRPKRDFDRIKALLEAPEYARLPWPDDISQGVIRLREMPIGTKIYINYDILLFTKVTGDMFKFEGFEGSQMSNIAVTARMLILHAYELNKIVPPTM